MYRGYTKHRKTRGFLYFAAQEALKTGPRQPKSAPRGPQDGPRGQQDGLRSPQDGPRGPQEGPKRYPGPLDLPSGAFHKPPRRPREAPKGLRRARMLPKRPQKTSKVLPRRPQEAIPKMPSKALVFFHTKKLSHTLFQEALKACKHTQTFDIALTCVQ